MKVFELRLKIYLLQDIKQEQTYGIFANFIDSYLAKNSRFLEFHETNKYKMYCFDQPYPTEENGVYKKGHVYTVRIRTVDPILADYFANGIANHFNNQIKGLTLDIKVIRKKFISEIYSVTPAVMNLAGNEDRPGGYWKNTVSFWQYEQYLKHNLVSKLNAITDKKIDENFDLYRQIEFINCKPISVPYKGIKMLGDKLCLQAAENEQAQELLYLAIGTGICGLNARGCGFVNYRYL